MSYLLPSRLLLAAGLLATSLFVSPAFAADAPAADPVVARVDGQPIMRSEVARELALLGPQAQSMPIQYVYPQVLERIIAARVVGSKGYENKLQNTTEAKDRLKHAELQIVADLYMNSAVKPLVTEEKIKARYDELAKKYKPEPEVRARHILVATEAEANDIIKQLKDGADFAKLAAEKSKDSGSMKEGGDLGYFPKTAMVKPFADAAFAMKPGELSDKPVKTDFGYHVIKVEDRRQSAPPALDAVRGQIQNQLANEMVSQVVRDLESKVKIERFNLDGSPLTTAQNAGKGDAGKAQ